MRARPGKGGGREKESPTGSGEGGAVGDSPACEGRMVGEAGQARGGGLDQQGAVFAGQPARVVGDGGKILVGRAAGQAGGDGAQRRGFVRDRRGGGIEQDAVERGQRAEHPQKAGKLDRGTPADGALVEREFDLARRGGGEDVRDRGPGTGRWKSFFGG